MDYDEIIKVHIGQIGLYQKLFLVFVCSFAFITALNNLDYTFIAATPTYWCSVDSAEHLRTNLTQDEFASLLSPIVGENGYGSCYMYERDYSSITLDEARGLINATNHTEQHLSPCEQWGYSQEQYQSTIVSEWDLICDRRWLTATSQAVFMAGKFTIIFGGWFSDRYGRKPIILILLCMQIVCRVVSTFSVNYIMFILLRFLLGAASMNCYNLTFLIAVELVTPKYRVLAAQVPYFYWSIGYVIVCVVAYFVRSWRTLNITLAVFLLPYLAFFCLLPESPRWLISENKIHRAKQILHTMAKLNKKKLPEDLIISNKKDSTKEKDASVKDLFKSWKLIRITLILMFHWPTLTFIYFGLVFYLPNLGGNIYLSTAISGLLEIPALLYVQLTLDTRLGRRLNLTSTFLASGVALLALVAIPKDIAWLSITMALIGRFAITAAYSSAYLYSTEIFPTSLRSIGLSFCTLVGRIGAVLAPYIASVGAFAPSFPPIIFGILAVIAGLLSLLLPETKGNSLPENFSKFMKNDSSTDEIAGFQIPKIVIQGVDVEEHFLKCNDETKSET